MRKIAVAIASNLRRQCTCSQTILLSNWDLGFYRTGYGRRQIAEKNNGLVKMDQAFSILLTQMKLQGW